MLLFICAGCLCTSIMPRRIDIKVQARTGCIRTGLVMSDQYHGIQERSFDEYKMFCLEGLNGVTFVVTFIDFPNYSTVIAHAGDGNFHTVILFDPNNEEHRREADRLNHFMVHAALSMEGTDYSRAYFRILFFLESLND